MENNEQIQKILRKNYQDRLSSERKMKGLYTSIYVPQQQKNIQLLPIQNLFYGNTQNPPRLEILLDHIKKINDMENGAFFLGGNLFYYPAGNTEKKLSLACKYTDELSEILKEMDKNKILFAYNGVNETKFIDDRKLKYPIQTTKKLAKNLGIEDRYYADTKVELNFIFNNDFTNNEDKFLSALFTSVGPISSTTNAITNKLNLTSNSNIEKNLIVDTSSSKFSTKKRISCVSKIDVLTSENKEQYLISTAGYTDMPQLANSKKNTMYPINQRYIELKIEPKNEALYQKNAREINTIKDDKYNRSAICLTIGVNYDVTIDYELYRKLNDITFKNIMLQETIEKNVKRSIQEITRSQTRDVFLNQKNIELNSSGQQKNYIFE